MTKKSSPTIDPRSAEVLLAYVGDGRSARNAPHRDLTHNDIARLAFQEELRVVANEVGQPVDRDDPDGPRIEHPDPLAPDQALCAEIVAELVDSGYFTTDVPTIESPAPDAPAPQPEA